jgi:hypothetical protein
MLRSSPIQFLDFEITRTTFSALLGEPNFIPLTETGKNIKNQDMRILLKRNF